ncbi:hypothetical protein CALCODRAFT_481274 [Calocera cornea HHB12733]|uniref:RRM domain-containing protein n=1 Tax=Calocera cornea HHB12733 TaxID=1353952 RepID=A0A165HUQ1_9BASI|nr:hypothetical protein CALCODRAFT_481274 [Calocera cornea HHB12733]
MSTQTASRYVATASSSQSSQPETTPVFRSRTVDNWIRLNEVPKTSLHNDVRRAVTRAGVDQRFEVYLHYFRFLRGGAAYLKFETPKDALEALRHIGGKKVMIMAQEILALPTAAPPSMVERQRGIRGRAIAAQKGEVDGTGLDAGTASRGRDVVLYGIPNKIEAEDVLAALKGFELNRKRNKNETAAGDETDGMDEEERAQAVYKLSQFGRSLTSRYLIRLDSASEAHRLVRQLHMTHWDPTLWGKQYMCRARVVY